MFRISFKSEDNPQWVLDAIAWMIADEACGWLARTEEENVENSKRLTHWVQENIENPLHALTALLTVTGDLGAFISMDLNTLLESLKEAYQSGHEYHIFKRGN